MSTYFGQAASDVELLNTANVKVSLPLGKQVKIVPSLATPTPYKHHNGEILAFHDVRVETDRRPIIVIRMHKLNLWAKESRIVMDDSL